MSEPAPVARSPRASTEEPRQGAAPALTARGERTRGKLVAAARAVFERDGFAPAKITDIAKQAKVAVGSFYTYFDSKEAVLAAVALAVGEELAAPLDKRVGGDALLRIRAGNRAYVRAYAKNARILAVMQHRIFEDPAMFELRERGRLLFVERAERAIRRLQREGLAQRDIGARFAAAALSGMVHAYCYEAFALARDAGLSKNQEIVVEGLTKLWVRALGMKTS